MPETGLAERVEAVRRFNRLYTRKIGVLQEGLLESPFSLAEVRVLYEIAHRANCTATELARDLGLDAGYLSRILRGFKARGFLTKKISDADGRRSFLTLTRKGKAAFLPLDERARKEVAAMLKDLSPAGQNRLTQAMRTIEELLSEERESRPTIVLRQHQPGDMGYVTHRHGALYAEEYGYNEEFEALVAEICAHFIRTFDAKRERCWIAEMDGEIVGSVFLVKKSATVAKLRLLLVEPQARGLGLGKRLVEECVKFARQAGYKKVTLWTQSDLYAARGIYKRAGFQRVHEEPHHSFGKDLVAETWELEL
jgi:DNA-binding MarR family transcriptional regulator/N-acetylglutamate synthase-like GNAT family acetyltransferase